MALRRLIMVMAVCGLSLAPAALSPAAAQAACSTADPMVNAADPGTLDWSSDASIQTNFTMARAAEGCAAPLTLPAGYDAMTPAQQEVWLLNSEREARGEGDLQLDPTLASQVAYNHGLEIATYGYFDHASPINVPSWGSPYSGLPRMTNNPVFANGSDYFLEDLDGGAGSPAQTVYGFMYFDGPGANNLACTAAVTWGCWGHRHTILNASLNWIGVGIVNMPNTLYGGSTTNDFGMVHAGYVPPATADTNPPVLGAISYDTGSQTATVSGVADSPLNVNDTGPNPVTLGVTDVVFYTNNIVEAGGFQGTFNTVPATQTAPGSGTWTAQIPMNPGDVLHAVAVDGSGNFTDMAMAPPATTLTAGANTVALPAATPPTAPAPQTTNGIRLATEDRGARVPAATPSAAALAGSIDRRAHRRIVTSIAVFTGGHWHVYRPGKSASFALYTSEGVVVTLTAKVTWRAPAGQEPLAAPTISLHRGWNFVAAPYPITGMTCHAVRFELAHRGDRLMEISIGAAPNTGVIMKPEHGHWGDDLTKHIPFGKGFWIKDAGAATWTPNPTQFQSLTPATA